MSNILITGATGLIGGEISKLLQTKRMPHRVLTRDASVYHPKSELIETFEGSFEDPESLHAALDGVSHAFLTSFDRPDVVNLQRHF